MIQVKIHSRRALLKQQSRRRYAANGFAFVPHTVPLRHRRAVETRPSSPSSGSTGTPPVRPRKISARTFSLERKSAPALRRASACKQDYEGVTRRLCMGPDRPPRASVNRQELRSRSLSGAGRLCQGFCLTTEPSQLRRRGYRRIDDRAVKRERGNLQARFVFMITPCLF